jgi:hypothetical protein
MTTIHSRTASYITCDCSLILESYSLGRRKKKVDMSSTEEAATAQLHKDGEVVTSTSVSNLDLESSLRTR